MGGLAEGRLRRWPVSGGIDSERDRLLVSTGSVLGVIGRTSWVNAGWLDDWVGVGGGVEIPEAEGEVIERFEERSRNRQQSLPFVLLIASRRFVHTATQHVL